MTGGCDSEPCIALDGFYVATGVQTARIESKASDWADGHHHAKVSAVSSRSTQSIVLSFTTSVALSMRIPDDRESDRHHFSVLLPIEPGTSWSSAKPSALQNPGSRTTMRAEWNAKTGGHVVCVTQMAPAARSGQGFLWSLLIPFENESTNSVSHCRINSKTFCGD